MTKKTNWKARACEMYHMAQAEANMLNKVTDKRMKGRAYLAIGETGALLKLLLEYDVDPREKEEKKIILLN